MAAFQKSLGQVVTRLRDINTSQRIALLLGGALVALSLLWLVQWAASPVLTPLLDQDLQPEEIAQVRSGLEAMGEPCEVRGNARLRAGRDQPPGPARATSAAGKAARQYQHRLRQPDQAVRPVDLHGGEQSALDVRAPAGPGTGAAAIQRREERQRLPEPGHQQQVLFPHAAAQLGQRHAGHARQGEEMLAVVWRSRRRAWSLARSPGCRSTTWK